MTNRDEAGARLLLSVIVVGRDGIDSLRPILACLAEQTIADRLELVAVLPARPDEPIPKSSAFGAVQTVSSGRIGNRGQAAAHGVAVASAPLVAFTENHCFPDKRWAEHLVAAHEEDVGGVAPSIVNANPESARSWAIYGAGYAAFSADRPEADVEDMPWHNASYRRDLLIARGNEMSDLLAHEGRLIRRLNGRGVRLRFVPHIQSRHVNEATWTLVLGLSYYNGRRFGGDRGARWPLTRRLAYAAAFPLLSFFVAGACMRRLRAAPGRPALAGRITIVIWLQSLAHAAGEAVGYLRGPKDTFDFVDREEFMILERLGGIMPTDPDIARFVRLAVPVRS